MRYTERFVGSTDGKAMTLAVLGATFEWLNTGQVILKTKETEVFMQNHKSVAGGLVVLFPLFLMLFWGVCPTVADDPISSTRSLESLVKRGQIRNPSIVESSGLVRSRRWPNVFWTHNDSGDRARIFAIRRDGTGVNNRATSNSGIQVIGAKNMDWEDIAVDSEGYLIIGDIGNNIFHRPKLTLYRVEEPDPFKDQSTARAEKISIYFPDRPPPALDSEALFWAKGSIYLLSKTRNGVNTGLYRVNETQPREAVPLIRIGSFDFQTPVTAADASPDGRLLAVLTYKAVWIFQRPRGKDNYLLGKSSVFPVQAGQCEAVCFDGDRLLIGNEAGDLFALDVGTLLALPSKPIHFERE